MKSRGEERSSMHKDIFLRTDYMGTVLENKHSYIEWTFP
jgi:hypothetical protein